MNSNLDPHQQLEEWLVDGAANDPPREMAFHASMCDECRARLNAFDSLSAVDVGAAGSPPPLSAPTRITVGLAWARTATAALGGILALALVLAGASQLIGFVGHQIKPDASLVAVASATEMQTDSGPIGTFGPGPATEPSPSTGPTPSPIPTFIPLPTVDPGSAPLDLPWAPFVSVQGISQTSITIRWTPNSYGGPVQKWEIWRAVGSGGWYKQGELYPGATAYADGGLSPDTYYSYRLRAVNTTGYSDWSNSVSPKTTPIPTPTPAPTGTPQCNDGTDNDSDGWVDFGGANGDPSCSSANDNSESPVDSRECNDTVDNDGDGYTDLADPQCGGDPLDNNESPPDTHQCNDGLDNDSDGYTDFSGGDPDCLTAFGDSENNFDTHQCNDGSDNEPDGYTDFGGGNPDQDCSSPFDDSENTINTHECNNGIDDEAIPDGFIDFAGSDPECTGAWDDSESF